MRPAQSMTWLLVAAAKNSKAHMWHPPGNCSATTETCLGTFLWCSDATRYQEENHVSRDSCLEDRRGTRAWEYPVDYYYYDDDDESCSETDGPCTGTGTDALCAAMNSAELRRECFQGHQVADFLEPGSSGCLRPGKRWRQDERCVGTAVFCAAKERQEAYGSASNCASRRRGKQDMKITMKTSSRQKNLTDGQDTNVTTTTTTSLQLQNLTAAHGTNVTMTTTSLQQQNKTDGQDTNVTMTTSLQQKNLTDGQDTNVTMTTTSLQQKNLTAAHDTNVTTTTTSLQKNLTDGQDHHDPQQTQLLPFLQPHVDKCSNQEEKEACLGTEEFCLGRDLDLDLDPQARLACLWARKKPPFVHPRAPPCSEPGTSSQAEVCVGTLAWCRAPQRIKWYTAAATRSRNRNRSSEETCLEYRTGNATLLLPWLEPAPTPCPTRNQQVNHTETCLGTEAICQGQPACLDGRESPAFQIKKSPTTTTSSSDVTCQSESCTGTWEWCLNKSQALQYPDKADCLLRRGLDLQETGRQAKLLYGPVLRAVVMRGLRNVTLGAVLWSQIQGGVESTNVTAEAARSCRVFLQGLASDGEVGGALRRHVEGALGSG